MSDHPSALERGDLRPPSDLPSTWPMGFRPALSPSPGEAPGRAWLPHPTPVRPAFDPVMQGAPHRPARQEREDRCLAAGEDGPADKAGLVLCSHPELALQVAAEIPTSARGASGDRHLRRGVDEG